MSRLFKTIILLFTGILFSSCLFWNQSVDRRINYFDLSEYGGCSIYGVDTYETLIYLSSEQGIMSVDVTNPLKLEITGPVEPPLEETTTISESEIISVNGNYTYSVDHKNFTITDISNNANPLLVASVSLGAPASGIAISDDFVFIPYGGGCYIFDTSNKTDPAMHDFPTKIINDPNSIIVNDNILYICEDSYISIWDIATPLDPELMEYTVGGGSDAVIIGDYLFAIGDGEINHSLIESLLLEFFDADDDFQYDSQYLISFLLHS